MLSYLIDRAMHKTKQWVDSHPDATDAEVVGANEALLESRFWLRQSLPNGLQGLQGSAVATGGGLWHD